MLIFFSATLIFFWERRYQDPVDFVGLGSNLICLQVDQANLPWTMDCLGCIKVSHRHTFLFSEENPAVAKKLEDPRKEKSYTALLCTDLLCKWKYKICYLVVILYKLCEIWKYETNEKDFLWGTNKILSDNNHQLRTYVTWSRGMSQMSLILILSYRLKEVTSSNVYIV